MGLFNRHRSPAVDTPPEPSPVERRTAEVLDTLAKRKIEMDRNARLFELAIRDLEEGRFT